jgi:hypothetical protein
VRLERIFGSCFAVPSSWESLASVILPPLPFSAPWKLELPKDPKDVLSSDLPPTPFPALQHLALTAQFPTCCSDVLGIVRRQQLQSIAVMLKRVPRLSSDDGDLHIGPDSQTLRACCSHSRLSPLGLGEFAFFQPRTTLQSMRLIISAMLLARCSASAT